MKGLNKDSNIHVRLSAAEKNKYKVAAEEVGLTLSGFFRYSAAKATRLINQNQDEVL